MRLPVAKKRKDRYNDRARGSFASVRKKLLREQTFFSFREIRFAVSQSAKKTRHNKVN